MQLDMKYIYQVYIDGSFSKAAEHLYITQPALSIAVQKAEASVGMPLFDRGTRPLALTPAGEIYIHMVREIMYLEHDFAHQISDIKELYTGNLRIGGSHYLNAYILPDILGGFSKKYPGIHIELVEGSSAEMAELLADCEIDLTLNCNQEFMMDFERYPAFYDHILLAVPKNAPVYQDSASPGLVRAALSSSDVIAGKHLDPAREPISLKEFEHTEFILLAKGNNLHERSRLLFEAAGFTPRIKMEISQLVTAYHLCEHDIAATFVSDRLVAGGRDRVNYYKLDSELARRLFYILLPRNRYTSNAVAAFIDYFLENERTEDKKTV